MPDIWSVSAAHRAGLERQVFTKCEESFHVTTWIGRRVSGVGRGSPDLLQLGVGVEAYRISAG